MHVDRGENMNKKAFVVCAVVVLLCGAALFGLAQPPEPEPIYDKILEAVLADPTADPGSLKFTFEHPELVYGFEAGIN